MAAAVVTAIVLTILLPEHERPARLAAPPRRGILLVARSPVIRGAIDRRSRLLRVTRSGWRQSSC
jgi:hypothetical protein